MLLALTLQALAVAIAGSVAIVALGRWVRL